MNKRRGRFIFSEDYADDTRECAPEALYLLTDCSREEAAHVYVRRSSDQTASGPTPLHHQAQPIARYRPGFDRLPLFTKTVNLVAVITPFAGFLAAVVFLWGRGFDWLHLILLLSMYVVTALGVTLGFHRLFTHRSFETYRPIKYLLAIFGSMAMEGPLLKWVASHRVHHQHSDTHRDPHSPHMHGDGMMGTLKGFWHAHIGWIFRPDIPNLPKYVGDLVRDSGLKKLSDLFTVWVLLGLAIPTVLGGLITMTWSGALLGFLWGGLARIFFVHHMTWSINSVCHLWGGRPFASADESRNNLIFGIVGFGEGWHNNHHAFPNSARHGLAWWQIDLTYYIIRAMEICRLAWKVKVPQPASIEAKFA
jgi:stearoyl-CoA desaturase (delta-9 desaturase)